MTVKLGLEVFLATQLRLVAGRRVGLVASPSSVDHELISSVERLHQHSDVKLAALYGPEHGLRGQAQAGETVSTYTDRSTNLPVYSLYGETKKPTPEMLKDIDILIFDMQDGGVRFYTYLATLAYVMQAAAEVDIPVIVLDRPTPINGVDVEGALLENGYESFVGPYPLPIRYGMTMGEIAGLFNRTFGIGCELRVVQMAGWTRGMWFDETGLPFVPPSPNLPTLSALTVYPGTCLVEGTNISEGRGTTKPFEYIGAPWIDAEALAHRLNHLDLPGVRFRPVYFVPTFSKHQGQTCQGVHVYVWDRNQFRAVETGLQILAEIKSAHPEQFRWREPWSPGGHYPIDLLSGGSLVRERLDASKPVPELIASWKPNLQQFCELREDFLLYPE
jgi:uncharacterized protein YbbC (DUF1343 family)